MKINFRAPTIKGFSIISARMILNLWQALVRWANETILGKVNISISSFYAYYYHTTEQNRYIVRSAILNSGDSTLEIPISGINGQALVVEINGKSVFHTSYADRIEVDISGYDDTILYVDVRTADGSYDIYPGMVGTPRIPVTFTQHSLMDFLPGDMPYIPDWNNVSTAINDLVDSISYYVNVGFVRTSLKQLYTQLDNNIIKHIFTGNIIRNSGNAIFGEFFVRSPSHEYYPGQPSLDRIFASRMQCSITNGAQSYDFNVVTDITNSQADFTSTTREVWVDMYFAEYISTGMYGFVSGKLMFTVSDVDSVNKKLLLKLNDAYTTYTLAVRTHIIFTPNFELVTDTFSRDCQDSSGVRCAQFGFKISAQDLDAVFSDGDNLTWTMKYWIDTFSGLDPYGDEFDVIFFGEEHKFGINGYVEMEPFEKGDLIPGSPPRDINTIINNIRLLQSQKFYLIGTLTPDTAYQDYNGPFKNYTFLNTYDYLIVVPITRDNTIKPYIRYYDGEQWNQRNISVDEYSDFTIVKLRDYIPFITNGVVYEVHDCQFAFEVSI